MSLREAWAGKSIPSREALLYTLLVCSQGQGGCSLRGLWAHSPLAIWMCPIKFCTLSDTSFATTAGQPVCRPDTTPASARNDMR
jgi:hypothetical protein